MSDFFVKLKAVSIVLKTGDLPLIGRKFFPGNRVDFVLAGI